MYNTSIFTVGIKEKYNKLEEIVFGVSPKTC
jgi:hypothetical protein